jgi:hypothetical protein
MNSSRPFKINRTIVFSIADDARVVVDLPGVAVGLDALLSGLSATVETLPVRATLAAQRADDSLLTASRIMLG